MLYGSVIVRDWSEMSPCHKISFFIQGYPYSQSCHMDGSSRSEVAAAASSSCAVTVAGSRVLARLLSVRSKPAVTMAAGSSAAGPRATGSSPAHTLAACNGRPQRRAIKISLRRPIPQLSIKTCVRGGGYFLGWYRLEGVCRGGVGGLARGGSQGGGACTQPSNIQLHTLKADVSLGERRHVCDNSGISSLPRRKSLES